MTEQERSKRIEALEVELAELKACKTPGQRFWELVSGTKLKFDFEKHPNTLFGFRDGQYVWEFDFKNKNLFLGYFPVWLVLAREFGLSSPECQRIIQNEVREHLKGRGVTIDTVDPRLDRWEKQ